MASITIGSLISDELNTLPQVALVDGATVDWGLAGQNVALTANGAARTFTTSGAITPGLEYQVLIAANGQDTTITWPANFFASTGDVLGTSTIPSGNSALFRFSAPSNGALVQTNREAVGLTTTTATRNEIPVLATEVSLVSGATTLVQNTAPSSGQVAVFDGYYYDEGSVRHVFIPFSSDEDALAVLEFSTNVIPASGSIESMSAWTDNLDGGATSEEWNYGVVDGQDRQFFFNRIDSGADRRNYTIHFEVRGVAQGQVVAESVVPVEDQRVLLGSGSAVASNGNVTISQTWGSLAAEYESVLFEFNTTTGSLTIRQAMSVDAADWVDGTRVVLNADDTTIVVRNMDIAGTTANMFLSGQVSAGDVKVYGIKSQKTVINTTDLTITNPNEADTTTVLQPNGDGTATFNASPSAPIDDQSASGYIDIGNTRIQWGSGSGSGTTPATASFPVAFPNTSYRVTANPIGGGNGQTISINSKTTTGFTSTQVDVGGTPRSNPFDWIAIGTVS